MPVVSDAKRKLGDRRFILRDANRPPGTGTYDDPVTIATAPGELNQCEIVYLPFLTKYGRVEDYCAQCGK